MPEFFNIILVSMSRLLFSSPAFVKFAERSLSGARHVQDSSSGEICSSPVTRGSSSFRGVRIFQSLAVVIVFDEVDYQILVSDKACESAVVTSLSSHDAEHPSLGDLGRFNELSGDTLGSKSATGGVINCPIIVSKPRYPPCDSSDDMILAQQDSSSHVSLVSDNSVDDKFNDSGSLDTLLSSTSCSTVTGTLQSSKLSPLSSGLGISSMTRKDGSGSFDGLGIISIKSTAWRHDDLPQSEILQFGDGIDAQLNSIQELRPSSSTYDGSLGSEDFIGTGNAGISDVFLQQTFLMFTQDPLRHLIPECVTKVHFWLSRSLTRYDASNGK
jgi:hypothetical protein